MKETRNQEDRMEMGDMETEHEPSEPGDTVEQEETEHGGEDAQEAAHREPVQHKAAQPSPLRRVCEHRQQEP